MYITICCVSFAAAVALLVIGLINAQMLLSEKGFYGMSFLLSFFAVVTVQKNARDLPDCVQDKYLLDSGIDNSTHSA